MLRYASPSSLLHVSVTSCQLRLCYFVLKQMFKGKALKQMCKFTV